MLGLVYVIILGVPIGIGAYRCFFSRRFGRDPCCARCGYNLTGFPSSRCPECGADTETEGVVIGRPILTRDQKWPLLAGFLLYAAAVVALAFALR